jgi:phytoene desaturase
VGHAVAVVGAGIGGLSAAIRLAYAGWEVDVFDRRPGPGGKAFTTSLGDFRFDTGPSLFTMPPVFRQLFEEVGERMEDWLDLIPLPVICRYHFPGGEPKTRGLPGGPPGRTGHPGATVLDAHADIHRFAAEIEEKTTDTAEAVLQYFEYTKRIYEHAAHLFLWKSLHQIDSYLTRDSLNSVIHFGSIDPLRSMHAANSSFFRDPRTIQLFDRYATYNGSSPFRVPATLNIIPYVEYGMGGYAVTGGIYAVPTALERLARRLGVRMHYSTAVEAIETQQRRIVGIRTKGGPHRCDVVVSNADIPQTYRLLGEPDAPPARRYARLEPSSSGLVFYWGVRGNWPELTVNNIFFSRDYKREFADIFERRTCPQEPTVYVNITSKVTPGDAPGNGENWFVLVNAPWENGQDWEEQSRRTRVAVLHRLEEALGKSIDSAIVEEDVLTPPQIEEQTGSRAGSLYGISSNTPMAAFLRHPNRSRRFPGLYLCGGSAHPGGGLPMVLLSGKIASDLVRKYEER